MVALVLEGLGWIAACAWIYFTFSHGGYWRGGSSLPAATAALSDWPAVAAVVPARNEVDVVAECLGSLLDQDYPGMFSITFVDDQSVDGTAKVARRLVAEHPRGDRLTVVTSDDLPDGWAGKMWAVHQGTRSIDKQTETERQPRPRYLLLTDADIAHERGTLRRLVGKAEADALDLVSLMVLLTVRGAWERLLIPAFVYFFQQLYPFHWVNDPRARTAGAAGGVMLVRTEALARTGGVAAIRGEVIDDCALARAVKRGGGIWLGLTTAERSVRPYGGLVGVWQMVARSAYDQLRYSPLLLLMTVLGLALVYLVPPVLTLGWALQGQVSTRAGVASLIAWSLMALTFVPTLRLYRQPWMVAPALPIAGLLYLGMTLDSARRYWLTDGPQWKGRVIRRDA